MSVSVAVFASSSDNIAPYYVTLAHSLGERLAGAGYTIVYGGGNNGLMGELARGVVGAGGKLVGVIPRKLKDGGYCYEKAHEIIVTETLHERKQIMHEKSAAFIALPGGFGTLDELFGVMTEKQLGFHAKPVILFNTDDFFSPLLEFLGMLEKEGFASTRDRSLFDVVTDIDEALVILEKNATR